MSIRTECGTLWIECQLITGHTLTPQKHAISDLGILVRDTDSYKPLVREGGDSWELCIHRARSRVQTPQDQIIVPLMLQTMSSIIEA